MIRKRPWWFWLATSLGGVLAALVFLAGVGSQWEVWTRHSWEVEQRRETAFDAGPLRDGKYGEWIRAYLARLPALATLGTNGLRFVAKPELEDVTYAAAFRSAGRKPDVPVTLVIVHERPDTAATEQRFTCLLPLGSYRSMTGAIDERTRDFDGAADFGTDGTTLAFERVRGSRVSSGHGNFIEPYRGLGEIVLARLREACPHAPLPEVGDDWYRRETCEQPRLNPPPAPRSTTDAPAPVRR